MAPTCIFTQRAHFLSLVKHLFFSTPPRTRIHTFGGNLTGSTPAILGCFVSILALTGPQNTIYSLQFHPYHSQFLLTHCYPNHILNQSRISPVNLLFTTQYPSAAATNPSQLHLEGCQGDIFSGNCPVQLPETSDVYSKLTTISGFTLFSLLHTRSPGMAKALLEPKFPQGFSLTASLPAARTAYLNAFLHNCFNATEGASKAVVDGHNQRRHQDV